MRDVTRAPTGARPWKPAILSATVFPGLGQLSNGHPWRALLFGGPSALLLVAFVRRIAQETLARMPTQPEALLDPALPLRLASEIHRDNGGYFLGMTVAIGALWLASIADAWFSARPGAGPPARKG